MKYAVILLSILVVSFAQRPPYAGTRPIGYPELASRFRVQAPDLTNRDGVQGVQNIPAVTTTPSSISTNRLPIDARGDAQLVDRLNQWPRHTRPFWLLNYDVIEEQRNQQPNNLETRFGEAGETIPVRKDLPRSPFAGGSSRF